MTCCSKSSCDCDAQRLFFPLSLFFPSFSFSLSSLLSSISELFFCPSPFLSSCVSARILDQCDQWLEVKKGDIEREQRDGMLMFAAVTLPCLASLFFYYCCCWCCWWCCWCRCCCWCYKCIGLWMMKNSLECTLCFVMVLLRVWDRVGICPII